jgi:hypothetical protein
MPEQLLNLLYGALGGGLAAAAIRILETYWVAPRLSESIEAGKKLRLYAKPLWLDCHELEFRLQAIRAKMQGANFNKTASLKLSPGEAQSLAWFTKEGYYITSTAYLIASVASWVALFQRDVVFLQFSKKSLTSQFFDLIVRFKASISASPSILWYHYIDGIGENLIQENDNRPMSLAAFSHKMYSEPSFRDYYDQLFQFLHKVAEGQYNEQIDNTLMSLAEIKGFLERNGTVPEISEQKVDR